MLWIIMLLIVLFAAIFVGFARNPEATAINFKLKDSFVCTTMQFQGHHFDNDGKIVVGDGPQVNWKDKSPRTWKNLKAPILIWGGWIFYIRFFVHPSEYLHHLEDDGMGKECLIYLDRRQDDFSFSKAETRAPENAPLDGEGYFKEEIVDPYLYMYVSPRDAKKRIITQVKGRVEKCVRDGLQSDAQAAVGDGAHYWPRLKPMCETIESDWGFRIPPESIVIVKIDPDEEFQKALKAEAQKEFEAKAELKKQQIMAEASLHQMAGPILHAIGMGGKTFAEAYQALSADEHKETRDRLLTYVEELNAQLRKADTGAFFELKSDGNSLLGLAEAVALWKKLEGGDSPSNSRQGTTDSGKESAKKGGSTKSPLEAAEEFHKEHGKWPDWWDSSRGAPRA